MAYLSSVSSPTGRRRSLDAEINLVPFIDLLSMCICFLLMTAVWMEIGALQVKQLTGNDARAASRDTYELDLKFLNPGKMEMNLSRSGKKGQQLLVQGATP